MKDDKSLEQLVKLIHTEVDKGIESVREAAEQARKVGYVVALSMAALYLALGVYWKVGPFEEGQKVPEAQYIQKK